MRRRDFLKSLGAGASLTAFLGSSVARAAMLPPWVVPGPWKMWNTLLFLCKKTGLLIITSGI